MTRFPILALALLSGAPAVAQDQPKPVIVDVPPSTFGKAAEEKPPEIEQQVAQCAGEKFVFAWGVGANPTKVTLCGNPGASHEEVVRMLDDAADKLEGTDSIPDDRKAVLVQQIRGKIAELEKAHAARTTAAQKAAAAPVVIPSDKYRPLPATVSAPLLLPRPKLSFECYTPGEIGTGGPCTTFTRDTRLTVKAGEALTGATALRFVRNGQFRAEADVGQLRKGQARRLVLPQGVCGGVVEANIEIQVTRAGQVVDKQGPYLLRC